MSEIDLTEAVEAAGEVARRYTRVRPHETVIDAADVFTVLAAYQAVAAPLIERQVREQIARDIETYDGPSPWDIGIATKPESIGHWIASEDCALAARIARGGAS